VEGGQSLRWVGQGSWGSRGWFRGRVIEPQVGGTGFLGEQRLVKRRGYRASGGWDRVPGGAEAALEQGVQSLRWVGQGSWGSRGWFRGRGYRVSCGLDRVPGGAEAG
jgi:hypothetical protein